MSVHAPRRRHIGLRARLVLLVLAALGPLAAFQVYDLLHQRERLIAEAIEGVQLSTRIGAERYQDAISDARNTLDLLARVPAVVDGSPEACSQFLDTVLASRPWASGFFLVDAAGRISCSTVSRAIGLDVAERDWYRKTLTSAAFTLSDFYVSLVRKQPTIAAALPLTTAVGMTAPPVLMVNLDLGWFDQLAANLGRDNGATILLVDDKGRGLSRFPALPEIVGKDLTQVDAVRESLTHDSGVYQGRGIGGVERIFGYLRLPETGARLMVSLDRGAVLAPIDAAILRSGLLFLAISALLAGAIWLAGRKIFVEPLVEAGRALRDSETFLRGVIDGSGDCIKVLDLSGHLEFISRNGQCLMEVDDVDAVIGKSFVEMWPEETRGLAAEMVELARSGVPARFTAPILTGKGNVLHVDVLITAIRGVDGAPERLVAIARDVTRLHAVEMDLRRKTTLLEATLANMDQGLILVDAHGHVAVSNRRASELLELPNDLMASGPSYRLVREHQRQARRWGTLICEAKSAWHLDDDRRSSDVRCQRRSADGHVLEIRTVPLDDGGVLQTFTDITHLTRAEDAAREAETLFRGLFDHATDLLFVHQVGLDGSFTLEDLNPRAAEAIGVAADGVCGRTLEAVLPAAAAARARADLERTLAAGKPMRYEHGASSAQDGQTWELIHVPLREGGVDGRISRIFASARDITHLRIAERAAKESEARYRLLADHGSDLIVLGRPNGERSYISPAVTAMLGYTVEEAHAISMREWIHPDDVATVFATTRGLNAERSTGSVIYRLKRKDGAYIWAEAAFQYVQTEGDVRIITAIRDVSERQRHADELRNAKEVAELAKARADQASQAKTDFLASMSHEIRTPLNAVIGFTGLIIDREADLPGDVRRHAKLVQSAGAALLTIVDDILDFAKVESGAIELEQRPFALAALVDNCVSIGRGSIRNKPLDIEVKIDARLPSAYLGDEARLRQILLNLLNNAIKFTHEGYIALSVRHEASLYQGERLRFSVSDTGIGIPKDKQARLFQRFSQADSAINRSFGGTGLGLAICRSLVELMGGEIGVFSDEGCGSTFWFTVVLPRTRLVAELHIPGAKAIDRASEGRDLLLVEDVEINQELARLVLESGGYRVDVIGDGASAVEAVQAKRYDLVLMDVQMPGMDGLAATRLIRGNERPGTRLPIIAMTANVLPEQVRQFLAAGMDDHVGKPFKRDVLFTALNKWLSTSPDSRHSQETRSANNRSMM
ncbi:PAS domain S-box protein [Methylobacterium iners]|uniref:histidine kinase n=1 Tax=Methylobacterium iners TaxID=418707 RepID=A0ABQ4S0B0_9HYPH|nr:Sensor histidine kinase RcsC [Methylobacterium iners]